MSYEQEVREYLEENPDATGDEIADSVGCTPRTARRWRERIQSGEGADTSGQTFEEEEEPRVYECDNCDTELEYLEKTCPGCGKEPAWSALEAEESA